MEKKLDKKSSYSLPVNRTFLHRSEKGYKQINNKQEEDEWEEELKEYLKGQTDNNT